MPEGPAALKEFVMERRRPDKYTHILETQMMESVTIAVIAQPVRLCTHEL